MSRFLNLMIFTIVSVSIYVTFSVKNTVGNLAEDVSLMKLNIRAEQEKIKIYKAEYALLTGASHISELQKELMPDLKIVSVAQIQTINNFAVTPQFAHNSLDNHAVKSFQEN